MPKEVGEVMSEIIVHEDEQVACARPEKNTRDHSLGWWYYEQPGRVMYVYPSASFSLLDIFTNSKWLALGPVVPIHSTVPSSSLLYMYSMYLAKLVACVY